jgi:hypothetical protein
MQEGKSYLTIMNNKEFLQLLRYFIQREGITLEYFAEGINRSSDTVRRWMTGSRARPFSARDIADFAKVLRLNEHEHETLWKAAHAGIDIPATLMPSSPAKWDSSILPIWLTEDGKIWRGDTEIEGWEDVPTRQRNFLEYLYANRGRLCRKRDIIRYVWEDAVDPPGDDSLRKLAVRLAEFIEINPKDPKYLFKVRGGHYRLDNAIDPQI